MSSGLERQLTTYIRQYREDGILLDTNVLLLYWAYRFDKTLVGGKRLEKYTLDAAELLDDCVAQFQRILTTATILTEFSNLFAQMLSGRKKRDMFARMLPLFTAPTPPTILHRSADGVAMLHRSIDGIALEAEVFQSLGFTDASIVAIAQGQHFVLTDDLDLFLTIQKRGSATINFTHMREAVGLL